ncbi:hypothetical protein APA_303 [Pseudanabaena sp. lw0831]|nr:hypothetical protein APA_303 [Pseudanabaena sp. lw0831]
MFCEIAYKSFLNRLTCSKRILRISLILVNITALVACQSNLV